MHPTARVVAALALLAAVLVPHAAHAGDDRWSRTFAPASLASWITGEHDRFIVVPAGEPRGASRAAAAAVSSGLRASGRAKLVMDESPLGVGVAAHDDAAIVQRAASLPVDEVVIVRVFPGQGAEMAVVTFYDRRGEALAALSVEEGATLESRERAGAGGLGVSSAASNAVSQVLRTDERRAGTPQPASGPRGAYDEQFIGVRGRGDRPGPARHIAWDDYYRSHRQAYIDPEELFRRIGREDLQRKDRSRATAKTALLAAGGAVGGALVLAGVVTLGLSYNECKDDLLSFVFACTRRENVQTQRLAGAAVTGVGGGVLVAFVLAGALLPRHPIGPAQAKPLVDRYNADLRRKLGLPVEEPASSRRPDLRVSLAPVVGPGLAGVTLAGSF